MLVNLCIPIRTGSIALDLAACFAGMVALSVLTGIVESTMARLRLVRVPQILMGAAALCVTALALVFR